MNKVWIRSQDREKLINADYIKVGDNFVYGYFNQLCIVLGKYGSKERALQVLDMIHEFINYGAYTEYNNTGYSIELKSKCIFEMPEE